METTQGGHPQVPPAKPPDDGQPNEEVPVNGAHVLNEAMSEDTSEDEMPTATAKTGQVYPLSLLVILVETTWGPQAAVP